MAAGDLKLLIADDEAPARSRLREMLADTGGWQVVGEAANGVDTLELCQTLEPDIVLLDIRMPAMDGIEVANHLSRLAVPPAIIFTTAYDEYAVTAFEAHAVGYLLKPVRRERLFRALEHAARITRMRLAELMQQHPELGGRRNIPVTLSGKIRLVPVASVLAFHAEQKYVQMLHEVDGRLRESLIDEALKALEDEFADSFVRIHRSALVRRDAIAGLDRDDAGQYSVALRGVPEPLPVSRRHAAQLREMLSN